MTEEDIHETCGGNVFVFCKHVVGCYRLLIVVRDIGIVFFTGPRALPPRSPAIAGVTN